MKKIIQVISLLLFPCWGFAILFEYDNETSKSHSQIVKASRLFFATKNPNINNLISPWSKNITTELYNLTNNTEAQVNSNKKNNQSENQANLINTDVSSINNSYDEFNKNILKHNSALIENSTKDEFNQPQEVFSIKPQANCEAVFTTDFPSDYKIYSSLEFQGFWKKEFTLIKDSEFTLSTGEKITTPFMSVNIDDCLSYTCCFTGWTIVRIPYENEYVMDIILPRVTPIKLSNERQLKAVFDLLSSLSCTNKNKNIKKIKTIISMPLFEFKQKILFTDTTNLYEQECFIHVNEKGTEAKPSSNFRVFHSISKFKQSYNNFVIDRPFFFAVSKIKNYNKTLLVDDIILLGKIENPSIK